MNPGPAPHGISEPVAHDRRLMVISPQHDTHNFVRRAISPLYASRWSTDCATSGPEACAKLSEALKADAPYNIALIDCRLPLLGGVQAARALWTVDPGLWVIFAGDDSVLNLEMLAEDTARQARMFVLQKPFLPQDLRQLLNLCAETQPARRPPEGAAARTQSLLEPPAVQLESLLAELLAGPRDEQHAMLDIRVDGLRQFADARGQRAAVERAHLIAGELSRRLSPQAHRVFRLDFDEFAAVLLRCRDPDARAIANDIASGTCDVRPDELAGSSGLSLSIGLVSIIAGQCDARDVRLAAQVARQSAYARGGQSVQESAINDTNVVRVIEEARTVPEIELALEHGRFEIWAQPIVPLGEGTLARPALEILLRMRGRNGALCSPEKFLPVAEKHGLAARIDRFVVRRTLELLTHKPVRTQVDYLSVNVSAFTLSDTVGLLWLEETLQAAGSDVRYLCLEITESAALKRPKVVSDFVTRMTALGVRFALDDFGAGFSTFDYLQTLPAHYLKIDGSLVRGCATDPRRLALLERVNDIGHLWDKRTIAEHIEDMPTLTAVRSIGVDYAQGYAIAEPAPFTHALALVTPTKRPIAFVPVTRQGV
ncbi:MAG: domain S-box protein [Gammaproteobacteria bacterium]|nr:domain S-box protein [Gammaproteobacteria bacterium]